MCVSERSNAEQHLTRPSVSVASAQLKHVTHTVPISACMPTANVMFSASMCAYVLGDYHVTLLLRVCCCTVSACTVDRQRAWMITSLLGMLSGELFVYKQ